MEEQNAYKSRLIYDVIDGSNGFYRCPVAKKCRSRVNIVFRIGDISGVKVGCQSELEELFCRKAEDEHGMVGLRGHRFLGGIRASLYNAITVEETMKLVDFMLAFMETYNKKDY